MLEHVEGKNTIKAVIAKRQRVRVAYHVSVAKELTLEFNAVRIGLRRSSGADVENEIFSLAKNCLEFRTNRVAPVVFRWERYRLLEKNRYMSVKFEDGAAPRTRDTC